MILVGAVVGLLTLAGCSQRGVGAASEEGGFLTCVEAADVSLSGSEDWGVDRQRAFWATPRTLACAVAELPDDVRSDALAGAFSDWSDDESPSSEQGAQLALVGEFARSQSETDGATVAIDRSAVLIGSLWVADADSPAAARGMAEAAVLEALRQQQLLAGFDRYLATHLDADDDPLELVAWYSAQGGDDPPDERATEAERARVDGLVDSVLEQTRGS